MTYMTPPHNIMTHDPYITVFLVRSTSDIDLILGVLVSILLSC